MYDTQVVGDLVDETLGSIKLVESAHSPRIEPRCRVCRDDQIRGTVNQMLARGASYAGIVRALTAEDTTFGEQRVTVDSVRRHCERHFPVQQAAAATYREVLERRARENHLDFAEGLAVALTPIAMFEVVMQKAFAHLVDDDTIVSVETGLRAAEKLYAISQETSSHPDVADMMVQLQQITAAVKAVVPREMWGQILQQLDESVATEG
ncbi:phage protein [Rhodococcus aetherivorans]|uniref:Phage protein n=1 Tax=Rhodococcus aetherivorans TaxID=191292 RepID=A0ABQ0YN07_9NOCA|nr:hypothetical protein [Rhodococcus aetherivorans]ETT28769.1 hypothetical protein RR21198_5884 [Rhodococcus rhodochrous ATCC 21198]NGP26394.1 hypothetical protein [Rhodococcus aetherivorans]GES37941.1 phage protein [Rhodococcus aetherivorans]